MVTEIRIYYEGDRLLKPGFDAFFTTLRDRAKEKRCAFRLIAAKGTPCRDFGIAIKTNTGAWNILLKTARDPMQATFRPPSVRSMRGANRMRKRSFGWSK